MIKNYIVTSLLLSSLFNLAGCSSNTTPNETVTNSPSINSTTQTNTATPIKMENILYVNLQATGENDGSSWENAFTDLQSALEVASNGNNIWVAQGTYYPSTEDTSVSFEMKDNVNVYGGFAGTETEFTQRNYQENLTVLSGDLGEQGNNSDNTQKIVIAANNIIDGFTITGGNTMSRSGSSSSQQGEMSQGTMPQGEMSQGTMPQGEMSQGTMPQGEMSQGTMPQGEMSQGTMPQGEMSQGTMPQGEMSQGTMPQGEMSQGTMPQGEMSQGTMPQEEMSQGGQSQGSSGSSSVGHMTPDSIMSGDASSSGNGAAIIVWQKAPTIQNCIITDNNSGKGGGVYVMGISDDNNATMFINTLFSDNTATGRGGAVSIDMGGEAVFIDCIFDGNDCTTGKGGAIYNDFGCSPLIENCLFINNTAESGAALANDGESNPIISNTTIANNYASEEGAGLYQGSGPFNDPVMVNSIIWGNESEQGNESIFNWNECFSYVSNSIVEGGCVGDNILDVDPQFTNTDTFSLDSGSVGLTASNLGGTIGFDSEKIATRTTTDYTEIVTSLKSLEVKTEVSSVDLTNPLANYDVSNVGNVVYVSLDSTGGNDGSSWENAFTDLCTAINVANAKYVSSGTEVEVWVSAGTYTTGENREDSIYLREGVHLYGGFSGSETSKSNRDYSATILSGEIGDTSRKDDNSYHVVIGADNTILDGFVITAGYADGSDNKTYDVNGGGLLAYEGGIRCIPSYRYTIGFDMNISNCTFVDNYALSGGAVYSYHGSNLEFENCTFVENNALYGGAVVDNAGANSIYVECVFEDNTAKYKGGAVLVDYGSMSAFYNTTFTGNESGTAGGAIYLIDRASQEIGNDTDFHLIDSTWTNMNDIYSAIYLENCQLTSNIAGTSGGAIYAYESTYVKLVNSQFSNNQATDNQIVIKNGSRIICSQSLENSITLYDTSRATYN